ncbi:MAG: hypothetical protein JKY89_06000 [Immundisolibacteraceae bacterium]|nr:hypothetical protein [Immundisolibacteraceae bacterium]
MSEAEKDKILKLFDVKHENNCLINGDGKYIASGVSSEVAALLLPLINCNADEIADEIIGAVCRGNAPEVEKTLEELPNETWKPMHERIMRTLELNLGKTLHTFYVTFGSAHQHMINGKPVGHKDTLVIQAPSYTVARNAAFEWVGDQFCMLYTDDEFDMHHLTKVYI